MEDAQFVYNPFGNELALKPLQEVALTETRKAFTRGKKIILQAATGFGKTCISAKIAQNAVHKGKRIVMVCDRIVLINQCADVFSRYGIAHGVIQANNPRADASQPVQIASIQTLKHRGCPVADIYIFDEVHCLHSAHIRIMAQFPDAYFLGLTATPYTKGLGRHWDFHIQPSPVKQLIQEGYLVPYEIYGPTITDLSKLRVMAGEFTEESLSDAYDKSDIIGSVVNQWKRITPGKKTIVFGVNIAHVEHIARQFNTAGIKAGFVKSGQDDNEREDVLDDFLNGDMLVICSVDVLSRGFDCPSVESVVVAIATRSITKFTQITGRGLRVSPGKTKAVIIDLGGNAERLGFPDDFVFEELDMGKKAKKSDVEPKIKMPKICPGCNFIKPIGVHVCPRCGFAPVRQSEVDETDGQLEKLQRKIRKEYSNEQKQEWLAQLNTYSASKGMKQGKNGCFGFSIHSFKSKFGCWPSNKINWNARMPIGPEVQAYITYLNIKYVKGMESRK
jgi:DNA repair protein RadD